MMIKQLLAAVSTAAFIVGSAAAADRTTPVKIGVLTDMTGPYSASLGEGSVIAAQMAIEDFGGKVGDLPIELIKADFQQKVDVSMAIAREWIDRDNVDLIIDVPNSSAALAVSELVKEKDKILITIASSADLTGKACNGHTMVWSYDNYSNAVGLAQGLVDEGKKDWFIITADYTFGHDLENLARGVVEKAGGKFLGSVRQPLGVIDQAAAAMQAIGTNPQVIGLANGGSDTQNSLKQLAQFGADTSKLSIAAFQMAIHDVHAMGLEASQGVLMPLAFFWNRNEETTAWSKRFMERNGGIAPERGHANVYSEVLHFLKAMEKNPSTSGAEIVKTMKSFPTNDPLFGESEIRIDGRRMSPIYVVQVKSPAESTGPWDYLKLVATVPSEQAVRPLSEGGCSLAN